MMIKIIGYEARTQDVVATGVKQSLAFSTTLATGGYIFEIADVGDPEALFQQIEQIGTYISEDSTGTSPDRIAGRSAYNINTTSPADQVEELANAAAAAGLARVHHVVISHRPGEVITPEMSEAIRQVFINVMWSQGCPQIWADHGDKPHPHSHGLIVSCDALTVEPVSFGEGWYKEKAQIAAAICEHRLELQPEPNRRYVADDRGVYHLLTNTKVADAEGNLLVDQKQMRTMQHAHREIIQQNEAPQLDDAEGPWPLKRGVQIIAKPRIQGTGDWQEIHENLAAIGLRYVKVGSTGVLEAVTNPGHWSECEGIRCAAGDAYANAALGKLSARLKADYVPPAPGLKVRLFVMPRYNAPLRADASDQAARKEELSEYKALVETLETDYKTTFHAKRGTEKGHGVNAARARRKAAHQAELGAVKAQRRHVVAPSKVTAARGQKVPTPPAPEISAILWGEPTQGPGARDLQRRQREHVSEDYDVKLDEHETRYFLDGKLAIVERERTIQLLSARRQARIHAMLLARARFRQIRIAARRKVRETLARIAAELELEILPQRLEDAVAIYRTQIKSDPDKGIVARARQWRKNRATLKRLRSSVRQDRDRWGRAAASFNKETIRDFRRWNQADLHAPWQPNPPPNITLAALGRLNRIDHNQLQLVRSRYNVDGARFLDDPVLLKAFGMQARQIVLPDVQSRLEAIEAMQIEQRRWIAAAVLQGRVSIQSGRLTTTQEGDKWAEDFWQAQKGDPSFARLLAVSHLRPDRFDFDLDERPDVRAWRAARARGDAQLIGAMAEEIFAASVRHGDAVAKDARDRNIAAPPKAADVSWSYRHQLFEAMGYDDAEALRRTKGHFAETYRGHIYRKPGEPDREWDTRTRAYAKNFGPRSGQYRR